MDFFNNYFRGKDKKLLSNIMISFALGIVLLITGSTIFKETITNKPQEEENDTVISSVDANLSYEEKLEKRLDEILSQAAGAGKVRTMIKLTNGREIVVAEDIDSKISSSKEEDNQGGNREINEQDIQNKKILISDTTGNKPLVLKEIEPRIEGVIIISEGGDNILVKDALVKAAQTVLGVEPHKVQVLKMKQ